MAIRIWGTLVTTNLDCGGFWTRSWSHSPVAQWSVSRQILWEKNFFEEKFPWMENQLLIAPFVHSPREKSSVQAFRCQAEKNRERRASWGRGLTATWVPSPGCGAFGWIAMWCHLLFDPKPSHPTLAGIRKFGFAVPVSCLRWAAPEAAEHAGSRWGGGASAAPWCPSGLGLLLPLTPGAGHLVVCKSIKQSDTGSSQLAFWDAKLLLMTAHAAITPPALPKADLRLAEVLTSLSVA